MAANARIRITATDNTGRAVSQAQRNFRELQSTVVKVGGAVVTASAAIGAFTLSQAQAMNETRKFASQLGITTQSLTELAYAFGQEGNINAEQFSDTLQELNVRLGEAAATGGGPLVEAFQQLGISVDEVRSLKTDEMILRIADAFHDLDDAQRSTFLSEEIFAGEAAKLVPLLQKGSVGVKQLTEEYRELAGVITEEEAEKLSEIAISFDKMKVALDGLGERIAVFLSSFGAPLIDFTTDLLVNLRNLPENLKKSFDLKISGSAIDKYNEKIANLTEEIRMIQSGEVTAGTQAQDNEWINRNRALIQSYNDLIDKAKQYRNEALGPANVTVTKGNDATPSKPLFFETPEGAKAIQDALFQAEVEGTQMRADAINSIWDAEQQRNEERAAQWLAAWESVQGSFAQGMGDAVASAIVDQESLGDALQAVMRQTAKQVISTLIQIGIQRAIQAATSKGELAAITGAGVASAGTLAAAYGPAALAANIASFGGAALAAAASAPIAASAQIAAMSSAKISGIAHDGLDYVPRTGTYLLEKGERVIKKEDNKPGAMGGNTYNFTIQAIDTQTGVDFLMQNEGAIIEMVQQRYESRGEKGGPIA